jgi:hypothetical protein
MELKVKLKIKEVEVELTMEDVKKLKELLEGLCETKIEKRMEYMPYYWHWWDWYYKPDPHRDWFITCKGNSAGTVSTDSYTAALSDNITYTLTK